jgi:hypothetical protein
MTNDQKIYNTAIADGMPPGKDHLAEFIVAQARHETGNYNSDFFTMGHNAFGYEFVPGARWQLPTPGPTADNGVPIAQYATLENSVHEITAWIKRRQSEGIFPANLATISDPAQYAQLLKNADYYGDTVANYTNALVNWLKQIGSLGGGSVGTLIIAVLLFLALRD